MSFTFSGARSGLSILESVILLALCSMLALVVFPVMLTRAGILTNEPAASPSDSENRPIEFTPPKVKVPTLSDIRPENLPISDEAEQGKDQGTEKAP